VNAIQADRDLREDQRDWIQINANLAPAWPVITGRENPPADADEWAKIQHKRHLLDKGDQS
jgi:ferredoxin